MTTPKQDKPRGLLHRADGGEPFKLVRHHACASLSEIVECYWVVRWNLKARPEHRQELLPHPSLQVVIEEGESAVHGISQHKAVKVLAGVGRAVGIKFWPGAFSAVCGRPACEFTNKKSSLAEIFGAAGDAYQRVVFSTDDDAELIELAEQFVLGREPMLSEEAALARQIVVQIEVDPQIVQVEDLVERFSMTKRTLQRLFSNYVGVSPKWVISRYRLHEAVADLESETPSSLTELALRLNYFDLAHFNRDFTRMVGSPPGRYARGAAKKVRHGNGE